MKFKTIILFLNFFLNLCLFFRPNGPVLAQQAQQAQEAQKKFMEFQEFNTNFLERKGYLPCPEYDPSISTYIFLFDGFDRYFPRIFLHSIKNSVQPFGDDFLNQQFTGDLDKRNQKLNEKRDKKEPRLELSLLNSIKEIQDRYYYRNKRNPNYLSGAKLLYYSRKQERIAAACAIDLFVKSKEKISLKGIGFSMGGHALIKWSRMLKKKNIKVAANLSIDPVHEGVASAAFSSIFLYQQKPFFVPNNVDYWMNRYQTLDSTVVVRVAGIKGRDTQFDGNATHENKMDSVLVNRDFLEKQYFNWSELINYEHLDILYLNSIIDSIMKIIGEDKH